MMQQSLDGITPRTIETPDDAEAVARILKTASAEKQIVIPRGGGTMMELGAPLERADILLSLEKLNRVLHYEPADLTVRAQAGITLAALHQTLAQHAQMLALDPPFPERATVGGILAANASGALRVRYGTARDQVIGMRVALANGEIVQGGGQVVKNVAGYDLPKLFIGALGTLGVIVEATFKLVPLPKAEATIFAAFDDLDRALQIAQRVLKSPLTPMTVEILDRRASKALGFGAVYSVFAKFSGTINAITRQAGQVEDWARENSALTTNIAAETGATWARLRDFIFEKEIVVKASVLPARLAEFAHDAERIAAMHRVSIVWRAHAVGIAFAALEGASAPIANAIGDLRRAAEKTGGHLIVQRAPRELRARVSAWGAPRPDSAVMRKLKMEFDPLNILNPGKFSGLF